MRVETWDSETESTMADDPETGHRVIEYRSIMGPGKREG